MERRKYIGRPADYIKKSSKKIMRIENDNLKGYAAFLFIEEVYNPRFVGEKGREICIADKGYSELCYLPDNENWMVWAIYDNNGKIIEWYFDISKTNSVDKDGNPYCDDLYLDIALMANDEILILDEDELLDAYNNGKITKDDYDLAYNIKEKLITEKIVDIKFMENLFKKISKIMKIEIY
ncbi:MAG: DUF402 domain-containing protein [Oscillospiraceae bacterium]|jgi:predicted RNA-binding protein associated with RNAse of E/G family|nr:DUF402 domain-containing protein [Oscillospiraceae bacterium]